MILSHCFSGNMVRQYQAGLPGKRKYRRYTDETLAVALNLIETGNLSLKKAARLYSIPISLHNKVHCLHQKSVGRHTAFTDEEELAFVKHIITLSDWGFPLESTAIRYLAKSYLDKVKRQVNCFKGNMPGPEWVKSFLQRHSDKLSERNCENISKEKALINADVITEIIRNIRETLKGMPSTNIYNYDETNLSDDPGVKRCIFKRGVKYPQRVIYATKSMTSVMYCASAMGGILPLDIVYKAEGLWHSWISGGPNGARYNRSRKGWFDATCFSDWFSSHFLPNVRHLSGPIVLIGDNLSSHFSHDVRVLAEKQNIRFVCLPPHSTFMSQHLDVAFSALWKELGGEFLKDGKLQFGLKYKIIPKSQVASRLLQLHSKIQDSGSANVCSSFEKCGKWPLDISKPLS